MGYYTEFIFEYKGVTYTTCERDGFEKFAQKHVIKLAQDLLLYRDYIKNMLAFLNIDRSDKDNFWPKWSTHYHRYNYMGDNVYCIFLLDDSVKVNNIGTNPSRYYLVKSRKSPDFVRFLNTRFMCDKIWQKYKLPKDMINYIQENFF